MYTKGYFRTVQVSSDINHKLSTVSRLRSGSCFRSGAINENKSVLASKRD